VKPPCGPARIAIGDSYIATRAAPVLRAGRPYARPSSTRGVRCGRIPPSICGFLP